MTCIYNIHNFLNKFKITIVTQFQKVLFEPYTIDRVVITKYFKPKTIILIVYAIDIHYSKK